MKKALLTFFAVSLMAMAVRALDVSVFPALFYDGDKAYVEMHYFFAGRSVGWQRVADSLMQARVRVTLLFIQGGQIVKYDKYDLSSPRVKSYADFRDLHRYHLKPGKYAIELKIEDLSRRGNETAFKTKLNVRPLAGVAVSDVLLLSHLSKSQTEDNFSKYGYHMEALPFNYIPEDSRSLLFYVETYGTDRWAPDSTYKLRIQLEKIAGGEATPYQAFTRKRHIADKDVYIEQLDITYLPDGDYNLVMEVRDRSGAAVASSSVFFHRSNPKLKPGLTLADLNGVKGAFVEKLTKEQLDYYLTALLPLLSGKDKAEVNQYFRDKNLNGKKDFLYRYFIKKDPVQPARAFLDFAKLARQVDESFYSAFGRGFETDRGRIYLKYGEPNDRIKVENEVYALPYEIWIYENLPNNPSPTKFLFYNRHAVGEDYTLLTSNARGERQNKDWREELYRKDINPGYIFRDNRLKESEKDDLLNRHPNSMAIRYFQDL